MLSMSDVIALQSVPIPDTVFPNLQSFRGTLYLAKKFTSNRPIDSLCILSSLPHEGLVHLTTGSVPLTTFRVHTAQYTEGCLPDIAQTFLNLEDLSIAIELNENPREDPWPVEELEPLKKLRNLRLGRSWHSDDNLFIDEQDGTRTKALISTLQKNHSDMSSVDLNRNEE